uniref:Uncharacterized protein n=1 Tax=Timema monikensis TaxID=170555 RepID=A0A7R9EGF4_9NEOP|nr:unnamed protein product [Timema monikensis]
MFSPPCQQMDFYHIPHSNSPCSHHLFNRWTSITFHIPTVHVLATLSKDGLLSHSTFQQSMFSPPCQKMDFYHIPRSSSPCSRHLANRWTSITFHVPAVNVLATLSTDGLLSHYTFQQSMFSPPCQQMDPSEIAGLLLKSGSVEEFCNQPPKIARDWLEKNSPDGARRFRQFLTQHGHRGIKEFDLMTQTWELDCSGLISMIQTMLRSSTSTNHTKRETLTSKQTVDRLKSPRKLGTNLALRWLLPVCRSSVARRENTKESFIKVIHKFRLAYRGLARLLVQEEVLPDESLVFFLTHYELGKVLETHDPVLINKAARRQRLWPQWERLKFPEISIGLPAPVKSWALGTHPMTVEFGNKRTNLPPYILLCLCHRTF